jgi:hypothetical protein
MASAVESTHPMSATLRRSRSDSRAETAYRERFPEFDTVPDERSPRPSAAGPPIAHGTPRPVARNRAATVRGQPTVVDPGPDPLAPFRGEPRVRPPSPGRAASPDFDPQRTREIVLADRQGALRVRAPSPPP